jgi:hypothetical protein
MSTSNVEVEDIVREMLSYQDRGERLSRRDADGPHGRVARTLDFRNTQRNREYIHFVWQRYLRGRDRDEGQRYTMFFLLRDIWPIRCTVIVYI